MIVERLERNRSSNVAAPADPRTPAFWQHAFKNWTMFKSYFERTLALLAGVLMLSGCTPPAARSLLDGKRLIEQGKYSQAIEKLNRATVLLATNAQAWNYFGLACHYAGRLEDAEKSYKRALAINHDLTEAHYNLACLWLAQNKPEKTEAAKTELLAYTLRRSNSPEGLLKLGLAQLRARELVGAEKSYADAIRLNPNSAEGLNGLGLVRLHRGHSDEAAKYFRSALKAQPDYRPALLNLAVVSDEYLKDRPLALQKFREYTLLKPPPPDAQAVRELTIRLEQELNPPRLPPTNNVLPSKTNPPPARQVVTNTPRAALAPKIEIVTSPPRPTPVAVAPPPVNYETVQLSSDPPVFRPARDVAVPVVTDKPVAEPMISKPRLTEVQTQNEPQRRTWLQRVNPFTLFRSEKSPRPTPLPPATETPQPQPLNSEPLDTTPASDPPQNESVTSRYTYKSPAQPGSGNRIEAQRLFDQAIQLQQAHRLQEAVQTYGRATQVDPAFFEAHYNLGLAATETGDLASAMLSYENALAIRPDALDARYNFALVLKQSKFFIDAANELEKLLAHYPNEARANLALGNLYSQQLRQPAKARQHYLRVLEAEPHNSQANAIRYWLAANPP